MVKNIKNSQGSQGSQAISTHSLHKEQVGKRVDSLTTLTIPFETKIKSLKKCKKQQKNLTKNDKKNNKTTKMGSSRPRREGHRNF
jgi:hypothetical protein